MGILTRKSFEESSHFQIEAKDPEKCCRKCDEFRRYPFLGTICRYLYHGSMDTRNSNVFGKSGCDRFSPVGGEVGIGVDEWIAAQKQPELGI
jgi:hypothetical protein